jgi:hypothetical protein
VPLRAGRGIAISRSLSGEEHCGQFGVSFVIVSLQREVVALGDVAATGAVLREHRLSENTVFRASERKKPRFAGLLSEHE